MGEFMEFVGIPFGFPFFEYQPLKPGIPFTSGQKGI